MEWDGGDYITPAMTTKASSRVRCAYQSVRGFAELGRPEHGEYRWLRYGEARALLSARLIAILDWARGVSGC